jgi:hypothetical protein
LTKNTSIAFELVEHGKAVLQPFMANGGAGDGAGGGFTNFE